MGWVRETPTDAGGRDDPPAFGEGRCGRARRVDVDVADHDVAVEVGGEVGPVGAAVGGAETGDDLVADRLGP